MDIPYPGGPLIDKYAKAGDPFKFKFSKPRVPDLNFSFSGLKTGFMNFINTEKSKDPNFIQDNRDDICASIQHTIIEILMDKLKQASEQTGIKRIAIAGGVSANSELRKVLTNLKNELDWQIFIPKFEYCTDNAAMIAVTGYYKYLRSEFSEQSVSPAARYALKQSIDEK